MPALRFITVKAYGDYVIAYNCLRDRIDPSTHFIGQHLRELARAVDHKWRPSILEHSEQSVPAAFDVRKQGIPAAARSLIGLRSAVARMPKGSTLVFDRLTARTKIIANGTRTTSLPSEPNIYLAYDAFLEAHGKLLSPPAAPVIRRRDKGKVRIFAGSRINAKRIPLQLCVSLVQELRKQNETAEIVALEGEYPELESSDLPKLILPRGFGRLIDTVTDAKAVISADSLPAHLAELKGHRPIVVSPIVNSYWLPRSSFQSGSWSLFEHGVSGVMAALERRSACLP